LDAIKRAMTDQGPSAAEPPIKREDLLSTGSSLLNLACTGNIAGGLVKGRYIIFTGDSSSGKTFFILTCFAEACRNQQFANHRLIFDDAEDGALMDKARYFGAAVAARIEPPRRDKDGTAIYSETIDDFYFHVDDAIEDGRPFIYVVDSMDVLSSGQEQKKFQERKVFARRPRAGGKAPAGDYGDGKAKRNSAGLRGVISGIRGTENILIIVSQTRDNIENFTYETKTRSGGRALKFYAMLEIWTSIKKGLKRTVRGEEMKVGVIVKAAIKKNRISGKEWEVEVPIYYSYGIDDIGSMVDYLVKFKHWKDNDGTINAEDFDFVGKRDKLIRKIEEDELEKDLKAIVAEVWKDIEEAADLKRKPRYV